MSGTEELMKLGEHMAVARKRERLSQAVVGERITEILGCVPPIGKDNVGRWERSERKPKVDEFVAYVEVVKAPWLLDLLVGAAGGKIVYSPQLHLEYHAA